MNWLRFVRKRNNSLYNRIFIPFIGGIIVTLFLSSSILYMNFERVASEQLYINNLDRLSETSRSVNIMKDTAMALSQQIYHDFTLERFMYYRSLDVSDILPTTKQLDTYRSSMPFIDSIYVYNGTTKTFYISSDKIPNAIQGMDEITDDGIRQIILDYPSYPLLEPIPRKGPNDVYTFINYNKLTGGKSITSAVIINISEKWIRDAIRSDSSLASDDFIIDAQGKLASNSNNFLISDNYPDQRIMDLLQKHPSTPDYSIETVHGIKSLVTFSAPDALGWRYIRITPYKTVTEKIDRMKETTILIGIGIVALSLLLMLIWSKRLYRPIDRMQMMLQVLEREKRGNSNKLKQEFLRNLLLYRKANPELLTKNFADFGIKLNLNQRYMLALFRIDYYSENCEKYKLEDRQLLNYAIGNIATELCAPYHHLETIDLGDDRILMLVNIAEGNLEEKERLLTLLQGIQSSIADYLNLSVTITVSEEEEGSDNLHEVYQQVLEASHYRLFKGRGSIIMTRDAITCKPGEYVYPTVKEKLLGEHVMAGKIAEAKELYLEIIQDTEHYPYTVINLAVSQLSFTMDRIIRTIERNNQLMPNGDFAAASIALNQAETIEEINGQFFALFEDVHARLDEKKGSKQEEYIQRINVLIHAEYSNPDLSINSIAEEIDMSSVYIGRLYKQYSQKSVGDYISEVRIEHSKRLLLEHKLPISEIAEQVGFVNNTYFYKVFKKHMGVTPNEFRRNAKDTQ